MRVIICYLSGPKDTKHAITLSGNSYILQRLSCLQDRDFRQDSHVASRGRGKQLVDSTVQKIPELSPGSGLLV